MTSILLVEDDPNLGFVIKDSLERNGFTVLLSENGQRGLSDYVKGKYDLCILDVMLPKKDGFTLGKEIKSINPDQAIIYASAKNMLNDKMEAFATGADDYITKPFHTEELIVRINAILKRSNKANTKEDEKVEFEIGKYTFNYQLQTLSINGEAGRITTKEADLLRLLCINANKILMRETALLQIWQNDSYFNGRSMDVFLTKLRKHLKDDPRVEILNVHGKGYKLILPEK